MKENPQAKPSGRTAPIQTIRARLSFNTLLALGLGMALAAGLTWQAVAALYINTQRDNLLAQTELIAAALQGQPLPENPQPYSQTTNIMPGIHTRLLTEGGAVVVGWPLAGGFVQAPLAEQSTSLSVSDLLQRPEIKSALQGTSATAIRRVLDGQRVLYAATPIYAQDGQIYGIVYNATPLPAAGLPAHILGQLTGAMLLASLLALFAGQYLARQIAHPLEGLAMTANAIARGDLQARAPADSKIQELRSLGQTFNQMTDSLRLADETKKTFIADVTHELRTPLTVIKGAIETLEDGALDDLQGRGALLESMQRETGRLIRLVNELLVLTRADAGALGLEIRPVDVAQLAQERCASFQPMASPKRVVIKLILGEEGSDEPSHPAKSAGTGATTSFYALADPDRLRQVFDNLLDNAIRHAPAKSTITVAIQENDNRLECSVRDQGGGIPAQHLPFIFERFYRVEKSRNRKDGGAGLGLAIARALIQAMHGRIFAQSLEGRGTTITFWLPRK